MDTNFLSFSTAQLNRFFPFFILLDTNMNITQMGEGLKNIFREAIGENFHNHFDGFNAQGTSVVPKNVNGSVFGKWEKIDSEESFFFAGEKFLKNNIERRGEEQFEATENTGEISRFKELFLANMSHEIRTPMNAIISMASQLSKTTLTDEQDYYLETIQTASKRLLAIIDDILDLSEIKDGKPNLEHTGFNLPAVLSAAMQTMTDPAQKKGLEIELVFPEGNSISPELMGDSSRIKQVVISLLSNAIKFTSTGSVSLVASVLTDEQDSQLIEILVKDTGIGMDAAFVNRLFDNFSQEHESVSREYGGIGLGMSISQKLVTQMGGYFKVESKKGVGSSISFVVNLQKGLDSDLRDAVEASHNEELFVGRKILIVDDNETNRLVASTILLNYGSQVLNAEDGEMAIDMVKEEVYDVILMDIQMPVLDGYEATKMLRQQGYPGTIIALTASVVPGEREKCLAVGMDDYLTKPIDEQRLVTVIDSWIKKKPLALPEPEPMLPLYSLAGLRIISKGREDFVTRMIEMFCQQVPDALTNLNNSFQADDFAQVSKLAHKLKSTVDHLEISSIQRTIRSIETISDEQGSSEELEPMISQVNHILNQVVDELQLEIKLRNG